MKSEKSDLAFYPGCSLDGMGKAYRKSCELINRDLGIELKEIVNYNCCGATEVKSASYDLSIFLPGRNLALAEQMGSGTVVAPCNGCVFSLGRANNALSDASTKERINSYLRKAGAPEYSGGVKVKHIIEVIYERAGIEGVRSKVVHPLSGVRVVCYYGCLYTRPKIYTGAGSAGSDNPEHPHFMDDLMRAIGAEVTDYPLKTVCCGGGHALADREVSVGFSAAILNEAARAGADLVVTMCPLGQMNIEANIPAITKAYGTDVVRPVVYFSQLMALAFGHSRREARLADNFSDAGRVLQDRGFR